ncbi:glycoside hydrolase family 15 protein [Novispirillum sp. DQ9]|uniref:glycoside hydrolase family 15 protein n=1 Tax=Novispirillum sp. DQ9 TaxID=3398612 RepID=UPI003C7A9684
MTSQRIEDYALIGDTHTAALVGRDGSIDWLCLPRFDAAACFAALLGTPEHGRWKIAPDAEVTAVERRYLGQSLVLSTVMTCAQGSVEIIDFMPKAEGFDRADLVRLVRGRGGCVPMAVDLAFRMDYGHIVPWVRHVGTEIHAVAGPDHLHLAAPVAFTGDNRHSRATFDIAEGESKAFVLTWFPSHHAPPEPQDPEQLLDATRDWWQRWADRSTHRTRWDGAVQRSLLTLKALTYSPTGGIVAAPTASLPEWIGGVRNWDYRYCWLRDAGLTLAALLRTGHREEAVAWREWLLRAVAGEPSQLQIMYGIAGERMLEERILDWLPGYEGSTPVRVGNEAVEQLQLDVYGQVLGVFHLSYRQKVEPVEDSWDLQKCLLEDLEERWRLPDAGIWEVRGSRRHYVHSKVMCWMAFDRALAAAHDFGLEAPVARWTAVRDAIHAEVCDRGFSARRGAFVQSYGGETLDASLLMIPLLGFLPPEDPRVVGTVEAIERDLGVDGLVYRYHWEETRDGFDHPEGAFLVCSFWLVEALTMIGRHDDAEALFERLLGLANDVGLYGEQFDPRSGRHLGNFPQAFSHVGLISAANRLAARADRKPTA